MAVEPIHEFKCKRCGRLKREFNKWWLVKVEGATWSFRDFSEAALREFSYAICSSAHLLADCQEHADNLLISTNDTSG